MKFMQKAGFHRNQMVKSRKDIKKSPETMWRIYFTERILVLVSIEILLFFHGNFSSSLIAVNLKLPLTDNGKNEKCIYYYATAVNLTFFFFFFFFFFFQKFL